MFIGILRLPERATIFPSETQKRGKTNTKLTETREEQQTEEEEEGNKKAFLNKATTAPATKWRWLRRPKSETPLPDHAATVDGPGSHGTRRRSTNLNRTHQLSFSGTVTTLTNTNQTIQQGWKRRELTGNLMAILKKKTKRL